MSEKLPHPAIAGACVAEQVKAIIADGPHKTATRAEIMCAMSDIIAWWMHENGHKFGGTVPPAAIGEYADVLLQRYGAA